MSSFTGVQGVRSLVRELADTEDQLRQLRLEPMTAECRARRQEIAVRQAGLIRQLRRRHSTWM